MTAKRKRRRSRRKSKPSEEMVPAISGRGPSTPKPWPRRAKPRRPGNRSKKYCPKSRIPSSIPAKTEFRTGSLAKEKKGRIPARSRPEPGSAMRKGASPPSSLDLGFLELDVLARDGIIFAEAHLLGDVPRILLGDVEKARVGGADELDLHRGRLGHDSLFQIWMYEKIKRRCRRHLRRACAPGRRFCQGRRTDRRLRGRLASLQGRAA